MSKMQNETDKSASYSLRRKLVRLRRIAAFILLASEDRCRVSTLFSNTHIFFENEFDKQREYAAVKRDFEWWWCVKNDAKQFVKEWIARW
jgi:hypothetical protein